MTEGYRITQDWVTGNADLCAYNVSSCVLPPSGSSCTVPRLLPLLQMQGLWWRRCYQGVVAAKLRQGVRFTGVWARLRLLPHQAR